MDIFATAGLEVFLWTFLPLQGSQNINSKS